MSAPPPLTVRALIDAFGGDGYRQLCEGLGLERVIGHRAVQRLGVALTGYTDHLDRARIQILGNSESGYMQTLSAQARAQVLRTIFEIPFPAMVITSGHPAPPQLIEAAQAHGTALLHTQKISMEASEQINHWLVKHLAPRAYHHGVLLDIFGVGVLLLGKSGIGKSELALELIASGHRLVADDLVQIWQGAPNAVFGTSASERQRHHIEIRGLGILNVQALFGATAICEQKQIELVIELEEWNPHSVYDRLGTEDHTVELAQVSVRQVVLPVRSGRSLRWVIEAAARTVLLRQQGIHSAREFMDRRQADLLREALALERGEE